MGVTIVPVDVGSGPGTGDGDTARVAFQAVNTADAALKTAAEDLQGRYWTVQNSVATAVLGERLMCNNHSGFAVTMPGTFAVSSTDYSDIWVCSADDAADVTLTPASGDAFFVLGTTLGIDTTYALTPGQVAIISPRTSNVGWDLVVLLTTSTTFEELTDSTITSLSDNEVLVSASGIWINQTKEEADIVDRLIPAIETTPYLKHETRATRASGTETITCADDPSIHLPISGNSVTISLAVPSLSLPVRGLSAVRLRGSVNVELSAAWTGLTVTTTAGSKLSTFPKGTAPAASGERGILVWEWWDDGTTDFMWAEWVNDT